MQIAGAFCLVILFALVHLPGARAHEEGSMLFREAEKIIMPFTDSPPNVDGIIQPGEYSHYGVFEEGGLLLSTEHNESLIFVGVRQSGRGWVGVALSSDIDAGANVVVATWNGTSVQISDNFAPNVTDDMDNEPDSAFGGTSDILAYAATATSDGATYEFAIPLDSTDPHDQHFEAGEIYPSAVAFNETAQEFPAALSDGDIHFLQVYVARATDNLAALQELLKGTPSPTPALAAMGVFSFTTAGLAWRVIAPRRGKPA